MDFVRFEKYYKYLIVVPLLIALITYWRFREINLSEVYSYVAQRNVIQPMLQHSFVGTRSVVWDFFGLVDKILSPSSILVLRILGLVLTVLNYFLLAKMLNNLLGQRFWGFLAVFLVSLAPFTVIAAVGGVPAASEAAIVVLFSTAIYKNEYIFGGFLSGIALAANLPGLIMFLILILDFLQNSADRKKVLKGVFSSTASFTGVVLVLYGYSVYSGSGSLSSVPGLEKDIPWPLIAALPVLVPNIVVLAGIVYLISKRRFDFYRTHFHIFMLWITFTSLCFVQPDTSNFLLELIISTLLAVYFIQVFVSSWRFEFLSVETFVFIFTMFFLFGDVYSNNNFLQNRFLFENQKKTAELNEIVSAIMPVRRGSRIVSNFCPAEISSKLGEPVIEIKGELVPAESFSRSDLKTIYIVDRPSRSDSLYHEGKILMRNSCEFGGSDHFIDVIEREGNNK